MKALIIPIFTTILLIGCDRETRAPAKAEAQQPPAESKRQSAAAAMQESPRPSSQPMNDSENTKSIGARIAENRKRGDISSALREMHQLMGKWNPIGLHKSEIEAVLGPPSSFTDKTMIYRFDHGEGGWEWILDTDGSVVTKVQKSSLD